MLWTEKYPIENLDDLHHHKELIKNLKKINKNNFPNIYFYGKKGCGKATLVKLMLKQIFEFKSIKLIKIDMSPNIFFLKNNFYYYIDILLLGKKQENIFTKFINGIISTKTITNYQHCFVITNFEHANKNFLKFVKYYLDKKNSTSKFVFVSNTLNKNKMVESFCLPIKIRLINQQEIKLIFNKMKIDDLKILNHEVENIYKISENDLTKTLFYFQLKNHDPVEFKKYLKNQENFYDHIYKIISNNKIGNVVKIREIVNKLMIKNFNIISFIRNFAKYLLKKTNNFEEMIYVLKISVKTTLCYNDTSKEIILIENFFVKLIRFYTNK